MALTQLGGANIIYLSVADGNLVRQYKTAQANTTERITKTGKQVFEEKFKDLIGFLTNINTKENDFGKQWQLTFKDEDGLYIVSLPYSSRYASSFLKSLPNLKLHNEVRFMPWAMKDKNDPTKTVTGITLYQNDVKIPPAFTREEPNGLPQMTKIKVKGKEQWDDSDMMSFLEQMALALFITEESPSQNEDAPF